MAATALFSLPAAAPGKLPAKAEKAGKSRNKATKMIATAYALEGPTASGVPAQAGLVAADPKVLPLGSRIRIRAGRRTLGEFVVADTGAHIEGNRLDIYMADTKRARRFGRRAVQVEMLEMGGGALEIAAGARQ